MSDILHVLGDASFSVGFVGVRLGDHPYTALMMTLTVAASWFVSQRLFRQRSVSTRMVWLFSATAGIALGSIAHVVAGTIDSGGFAGPLVAWSTLVGTWQGRDRPPKSPRAVARAAFSSTVGPASRAFKRNS